MARVFDVIEYPSEMQGELVHRFPEQGIGDYRIGSQLIVREAQAAGGAFAGRAVEQQAKALLAAQRRALRHRPAGISVPAAIADLLPESNVRYLLYSC